MTKLYQKFPRVCFIIKHLFNNVVCFVIGLICCFTLNLFCISESEIKSPLNEVFPELFPEIRVTCDTREIFSGDIFDFGDVSSDEIIEKDFIIENSGNSDLLLNADPVLLIEGPAEFTIAGLPDAAVRAGEKTSFTIRYTPGSTGVISSLITLKNNDVDEYDFSFTIIVNKSYPSRFSITPNISLFFTGPSCDGSLENTLIENIEKQSKNTSLDICIYGLSREKVIRSIENAVQRGVHVRFVGNKDGSGTVASGNGNYYNGYKRIAAVLDDHFPYEGKKRVNFPEDSGFADFILINNNIMHNKFVLFSDTSGDRSVLTGSTNFTDSGFALNNNNALLLHNNEISSAYQEHFEYMLGLADKEPVTGVRHFLIDGIKFSLVFSPHTNVMDYLVDFINDNALNSIHFMIFSFTYNDLVELFKRKFQSGVVVKGIFDESQLGNSLEESLAWSGVPCRVDGNYNIVDGHGGKLHHKTMVLDDSIVVTGSFNWSNNANFNNDENLLAISSPEIAGIYKKEWQMRWDEAVDIVPDNKGIDTADYQDILINEVMWMGSRKESDAAVSSDEFIELKNLTNNDINLYNWVIDCAGGGGKPYILKEWIIKANDYLVLLRKDISDSAFKPGHDKFTDNNKISISNSNLQLVLRDYKYKIIDYAGNGSSGDKFSGLSGTVKKSMARCDPPGDGRVSANLFTSMTQVNISPEYDYLAYNCATPGTDNYEGELVFEYLDVVFSEIGWAGTDECEGKSCAANEWIELYNNTDNDINLFGWSIGGDLEVQLSEVIPARSYFLLERTDDDSVPEKQFDLKYTGGLKNDGAHITLYYIDSVIDDVDMSSGWAAGSNNPKLSMERICLDASGDAGNWRDGVGDVEGAENSSD